MSAPHAQSGEVIRLQLGERLGESKTTALIKTSQFEVIRLVLAAGKEIPSHRAPGWITIQCLEGRAALVVGEKRQELTPGDLVYLEPAEPHAVTGIETSALLVTLALPK